MLMSFEQRTVYQVPTGSKTLYDIYVNQKFIDFDSR